MRRTVNQINKGATRGFTLVELIATILILAMLLTIAVPSYISYQARAKMVEVIKILDTTLDEARKQFVSSNSIPSSVLGFNSGSFSTYTSSPYVAYIYYDDGSTWNNAGKAAMVQAVITSNIGNAIPGFVAGTNGAKNRVTMAFVASGEVLRQYCGSWVDDGTQIPMDYLPSGCQSDVFQTLVTG